MAFMKGLGDSLASECSQPLSNCTVREANSTNIINFLIIGLQKVLRSTSGNLRYLVEERNMT